MIGAYLQAFIRRYAGQAWSAVVGGGVDADIVKCVHTHDPEQHDFKANDLPALYLFRQGSADDPQNTTEDWRVETDLVPIFWILPPAPDLKQGARGRAISQVAKLIGTAIRRGRDPSYIIDGDPDPQAATEGSVVIRHAGAMKIDCGRWRSGTVAIKRIPSAESFNLYDACIGAIRLTEHITELPGVAVPTEVGPTLENTFPARVSATVEVNGVPAGEYRDPLTLVP